MSDQDRPRNPFGRGERTIIRPNPGGRLPSPAPGAPAGVPPAHQSPSAPAPAGYAPPAAAPRPYSAPTPVSPSYPGAPAPSYPAPPVRPSSPYAQAPSTPAAEEWIKTPTVPQVPAAADQAQAPILRVDDLVAPNANPIMRAAGPVLQLLGRLRVALLRAPFGSLMEQVSEAVKFFEKDIRSAGVSEQQSNNAKYILCATADDIVQHIPNEERHLWAQFSMLARFFGERIGGVRFFETLNHSKLDPLVNYPVLELHHACLALGFQGVYRTQPGGIATLQQIQRDLYETLRRVKPKVVRDLSPHWKGQALAAYVNRLRVPVWVVASVAAALLLALYIVLRILLSGSSDAVAERTSLLHSNDKLALFRRAPAPPPPPPPPPKPPEDWKPPDPCSTIRETATSIVIKLCGEALFDSGQAVVKDDFKQRAAGIATFLDKYPGRIKVTGHTDNTPIHNVRFPSNFALSIERAKAVAAVLKTGLHDPDRIDVDGKGPDVPIASNATSEGRSMNRRVEITIGRTE
jgi:type VI secretion system protein ImpK